MIIKMPYGAVGTEVITEFESDVKITDFKITKGEVEKIDNNTLQIKTIVEPKNYTVDLAVRTTRGLQFYKVETRI